MCRVCAVCATRISLQGPVVTPQSPRKCGEWQKHATHVASLPSPARVCLRVYASVFFAGWKPAVLTLCFLGVIILHILKGTPSQNPLHIR
jgi:hypothetical protein